MSELITVKATTWAKQHAELWEMLVPKSGKAETLQGEVIRCSGKIAREILDNGGINWDGEYKRMLASLKSFLASHKSLSPKHIEALSVIESQINNRTGDDKKNTYALEEFAVDWVLLNPKPIKEFKADYKR